jgi:hypothetical protein
LKHGRQDYNRIQDPAGLIPEDEPVFLVRGQDVLGASTARFWADEAELSQKVDAKLISVVRDLADKMEAWPKKKVPDMPTEIN